VHAFGDPVRSGCNIRTAEPRITLSRTPLRASLGGLVGAGVQLVEQRVLVGNDELSRSSPRASPPVTGLQSRCTTETTNERREPQSRCTTEATNERRES